jgi:hypothetical protein
MCFPSRILRALSAIMVSATFINASQALAAAKFAMSVPQGFEDLAAERKTVLDVYAGGIKLGEARATIRPGIVRFDDARAVAQLVPDVADLAQLAAALSGSLPSNAGLACSAFQRTDCGVLRPSIAGVILNEDRFRVDIFVNPFLLKSPEPGAPEYLAAPKEEPTIVSLSGATVSGSSDGDWSYHLQNRSIVSIGALRFRSDAAIGSRFGLSFDNLTAELDRADWRYLAGVFWAPGSELVGRRRLIGVGASTQLDTRSDKDLLIATPLTIFMQGSGRVEIFIDGRLVTSGIYSAGQKLIDTSQLPNGAYEVLIRVKEDGRPTREERRFFTKGTQMAPLGRPMFSVFAGFIPTSDSGLSISSNTLFYKGSAAYRLSPGLGIDGTVTGTQHKAIAEAGLTLHTRLAQLRLGALLSTSADAGAVLRASTVGQGPLAISFDVRKIKSHDGQPLLPVSNSVGSFSEDPETNLSHSGSYTQALALIGYRIGRAQLRFTGIYRRNGSEPANYSVGSSFEMPVVRTPAWQASVQVEARKTERDFASLIGVRVHGWKGSLAFSGSAGISHSSGEGRSNKRVGESQVGWSRQLEDETQLSAEAAYGEDQRGSYGRASGFVRSPIGNGRADVLHNFGSGGATQFTANLNTGLVAAGSSVRVGGLRMDDSAVVLSLTGTESGQLFDVLVDDVVRGRVESGHSLILFLPAYQQYALRLKPRRAQVSNFETGPQIVTLYPGNVAKIEWTVTPLVILFGRAIDANGRPIANANITGPYGVGLTNGEGYFQIEARVSDQLKLVDRTGASCSMTIAGTRPTKSYIVAGDVNCR